MAAGIIAAFAVAAWHQTGYWYDSESLWVRDMMYPNAVAYYNLGLALAAENRHKEAIQQFEMAYKINPTDEDTLVSYAQSLEALGRIEEAVTKYHAALAVNEKSVLANDHLARILRNRGKDREKEFRRLQSRIFHGRVGGARNSQLYGALREPVQNSSDAFSRVRLRDHGYMVPEPTSFSAVRSTPPTR